MKTRLRAMPLAWLVFSIIYLLFAMSIEPRRMPADREGWDPGSNAIPIGIGYIMVAVSAYLVISDRNPAVARPRRPAPSAAPAADVPALIAVTVAATVAYIAAFRGAGFVIATTVLMMTLTYFYTLQRVRLSDVPNYVGWLLPSLVTTIGLYSLGRWIIRWTQYFGRTLGIEILRNRLFTAVLALAAWAVVTGPLYAVARRHGLWKSTPGSRAAIVTCITTLGLYLVFQQIFRVSLPGGFIAW